MTRITAPYTIGSLCSGYGGLELGAADALGPIQPMWHAEHDPASKLPTEQQPAARVLAARWPGTPNLGDIAAITADNRWHDISPVDVICAGYPCQGESDAGLRRGTDDPRWQWPNVRAAIRDLRPRLVVLENVRGHLRRSFPRVVADLAAIGYVGRWTCVPASDVGAPHRRDRLYAAAWPAEAGPPRLHGTAPAAHADSLTLLPTPTGRDHKGAGWGDEPGRPLSETIHRLLPTPQASHGTKGGPNQRGSKGDFALPAVATLLPTDRWGEYAAAITRWETILGRTAPDPTQPGRNGRPQLSPLFVEWMMGLNIGWVTAVVDHRGHALRVLGNGVVPQAAAHAIRQLLAEPEQPALFHHGVTAVTA